MAKKIRPSFITSKVGSALVLLMVLILHGCPGSSDTNDSGNDVGEPNQGIAPAKGGEGEEQGIAKQGILRLDIPKKDITDKNSSTQDDGYGYVRYALNITREDDGPIDFSQYYIHISNIDIEVNEDGNFTRSTDEGYEERRVVARQVLDRTSRGLFNHTTRSQHKVDIEKDAARKRDIEDFTKGLTFYLHNWKGETISIEYDTQKNYLCIPISKTPGSGLPENDFFSSKKLETCLIINSKPTLCIQKLWMDVKLFSSNDSSSVPIKISWKGDGEKLCRGWSSKSKPANDYHLRIESISIQGPGSAKNGIESHEVMLYYDYVEGKRIWFLMIGYMVSTTSDSSIPGNEIKGRLKLVPPPNFMYSNGRSRDKPARFGKAPISRYSINPIKDIELTNDHPSVPQVLKFQVIHVRDFVRKKNVWCAGVLKEIGGNPDALYTIVERKPEDVSRDIINEFGGFSGYLNFSIVIWKEGDPWKKRDPGNQNSRINGSLPIVYGGELPDSLRGSSYAINESYVLIEDEQLNYD